LANLVIISEKQLFPEFQIQAGNETIHYFYLWGESVATATEN